MTSRRTDDGTISDRPRTFPPFLAAWRWWLPPALVALALALIFLDPFAGDWDALDYTVLALEGRPSSMLFGRTLFIFFNRLLWLAAHAVFSLPAEQSYLLFKYAVVVQSPLAVIACWALARAVTGDERAALVAALLVAVSPFYVIYSGQAMTEIPSLLCCAAALAVHAWGLRRNRAALVLCGAALLGASVNIREATGLYAPWLLVGPYLYGWRTARREIAVTLSAVVIFFAAALGPFAVLYLANIQNYQHDWHGWIASLRAESAVHPISWVNFGPLLAYFFIAAPLAFVALPVAAYREWRERGLTPLLGLAAIGLAANLSLIMQYSVVINGRYLLTGLPGIVPLVADYFVRAEVRRTKRTGVALSVVVAAIALVTLVIGVAVYPMAAPTIAKHGYTKWYRARLSALPQENAVVMAGTGTVSVTFWRGVGLGRWEVIGTGGGWPGDNLTGVIEDHLRAGRRVFLDADPRLWMGYGWQRA
ncbi:MAG TPA: glycosyltransferase family 39 protein, partial [Pyrinomonadaceae bacterium]|nr:glycosyltransferase family 39 protein [Pyrinomonadaceae bacterium]